MRDSSAKETPENNTIAELPETGSQQSEQPEVSPALSPENSSAAHATQLMRQTTIVATSNIAAHSGMDGGRGINSGSSFAQGNFWGNINYFTGSNETTVTGKYDLSSTGLTIGYDYVADHLNEMVIGGAFTYAKGDVDRNSKNIKLDQDLYIGSLYSKFMLRQLDMLATAHFGVAKNTQNLGNPEPIKSDYDSKLWGLGLQGGYTINARYLDIRPLVEFNYLNSSFDDINIPANDDRIKIQNGDITVTELGAGVQLFKTSSLIDKGEVKFHGQLMAYHDFNDDKLKTSVPFSTSPYTIVSFDNEIKSRERYRAGLGIGIRTTKNLSFDLDYDYFWNDNSSVNAFSLRVGCLF